MCSSSFRRGQYFSSVSAHPAPKTRRSWSPGGRRVPQERRVLQKGVPESLGLHCPTHRAPSTCRRHPDDSGRELRTRDPQGTNRTRPGRPDPRETSLEPTSDRCTLEKDPPSCLTRVNLLHRHWTTYPEVSRKGPGESRGRDVRRLKRTSVPDDGTKWKVQSGRTGTFSSTGTGGTHSCYGPGSSWRTGRTRNRPGDQDCERRPSTVRPCPKLKLPIVLFRLFTEGGVAFGRRFNVLVRKVFVL